MSNSEQIERQLREIPKIDIERREKFYDWIKNVVSISVVFLGLIISLKSENCMSDLKHFFFVLSLSTMTIGIIFGIIILYSEIHVLNLLRKNILIHTQELIDKKNTRNLPIVAEIKGYKLICFFCFLFYLLSLVSIIIYSSIKF